MHPSSPRIDQDDAALKTAAAAFMAARGYQIQKLGPDALIGRRDARVIGAVILSENDADPTKAAFAAINALRSAGLPADQIVPIIKRSRAGLNRGAIAEAGGSPLTPPHFFDWYFRARRYDDADDSSVLSDRLRRKVRNFKVTPRAPQPYRRLASFAPDAPTIESGRDLYERLAPDFAALPEGPRLIVLCGPAGVGKSVLTAELLETAQTAFNTAKSRDQLGSRPILFEPAELGSTAAGAAEFRSFRDLVARLFGSEITSEVPSDAFSWLHRQGLNSWILDGLDEFFRRQTNFFETLQSALEAPGSRARVLFSTRDSLFASSDALRAFLHHRLATRPEQTEIYELERWDREAKRAYIAAVLTAEQGEAGQPQIDAIATRIEARPDLETLSDLPFYCSRLVQAIRKGEERALANEFALLQFTVDAIIDREIIEKQVMRLDEFVADFDRAEIEAANELNRGDAASLRAAIEARGRAELEDMLGMTAYLYRFAAETPETEMDAADWIDGVLPSLIAPDLDEESARRLELALAHFPLFARGAGDGDEGAVRFVHMLVAEYLASTHALNLLRGRPTAPKMWEMALGRRRDWERTVYFRRLAAELRADSELRRAAEAIAPALTAQAAPRLAQLLQAV
ncbi:MAG: ATP-binding protein [Neomegalonema sp.]|nr:ATP-binding protein [Neomegalonema sp.]